MEEYLPRLSEIVASRLGLHFPRERLGDLARGVKSAAAALGISDVADFSRSLIATEWTPEQTELIAGHLTVGETYFFREKASLEVFRTIILPEIIATWRGRDQRLRIWSAGCCTGEEPYTIAMMLTDMTPELAGWRITILATDINRHFLAKANRGVYGNWSFRETSAAIKERHFRQTGDGRFEISPEIRKMVTFSLLNLVDDTYPSVLNNTNAMDVIFCRNVLMYFTPEHAASIVSRLHLALVENGWLVVSPVETGQEYFSQFATANVDGNFLYRKSPPELREEPVFPASAAAASGAFETPAWASFPEPEPSNPPGGGDRTTAAIPVPPAAPSPLEAAATDFGKGRYAEAAETLSQLLATDPLNAAAMALLARTCANQGRLQEARGWCERLVAADRMSPGAYLLLATVLLEKGDKDEAERALRQALYLDPRFVYAHFTMGNLARSLGKAQAAAKHFHNARDLLQGCDAGEVLPDSEGMTAGRMSGMIRSLT